MEKKSGRGLVGKRGNMSLRGSVPIICVRCYCDIYGYKGTVDLGNYDGRRNHYVIATINNFETRLKSSSTADGWMLFCFTLLYLRYLPRETTISAGLSWP